MEQLYAKTKEGDLLRATIDYDQYPISPREDETLGTMFIEDFRNETDSESNWKTPSLYDFIREQMEKAGRGDEIVKIEKEARFGSIQENNLATYNLYNAWKKDLCAVVPIDHYSHGGDAVRATHWYGENALSGMIYVGWDNPEVQFMLKNKSREETQKWAKNILVGEIMEYNNYLTGFVYTAKVEVFDKYKMQWGDNPNILSNIYPDDKTPYEKQALDLAQNAIADTGFLSGTYDFISEEEAQKITTTLSVEYKAKVGEQYISEIKDNMAQFDQNINHAINAISLVYANSDDKTKCAALNAYLKENGCTTKDKTLAFVSSKLNAQEKNIPQLRAGQENCETLIAHDRYNQTRGGIIIDYTNKTFALWQGQGDNAYADNILYPNGSKTQKASWKNCVEKGKLLLQQGFKEGEDHNSHARITVKEAAKTIKHKEVGMEM